jgi:LPXTG-motif cell wall-anchored protein
MSNRLTKRHKYGVLATTTLATFSMIISSNAYAAQPTVELGTASSFAVLAGSAITNTGPTTVSGTAGGDMGSSPTASFTGEADVTTTGTKYTAAATAVDNAKADLVNAYDDAAGRTPFNTVSADLGGQTLTAGVYKSASSLGLTGTLTLDGENNPDAVFIFQAGSTLTTASASSVTLINGAQPCNVFWQVGSSATFGTTTDFIGHVFALTSITANNRATFDGQLLARNGAVTLNENTIVNNLCEEVTPTPTPTDTETPTPTPTDSTDTGGELPDTDTNDWLLPLGVGLALAAVGAGVLVARRKRN